MKRGDRFIKQRLTGWRGGRKLENTAGLRLFFFFNSFSNSNLPSWESVHIYSAHSRDDNSKWSGKNLHWPRFSYTFSPGMRHFETFCCISILSFQISGCMEQCWRSFGLISPPSIPITVGAEDGCSQRVNKWPRSKNESISPFLFMLLCLTSFSGAVSYTSVTLPFISFPGCYVCHLKCFGFHKWNINIAKATNMPSYVTGKMSEDVENVGRCHIIFP